MPDNYLEPEFAPHYTAWKANPNPKTTGQFLKTIEPVLNTAVRTYVGTQPSPTMRSRAKIMALKAAEGYDPSRAKLRTHLMTQLQGLRRQSAKEQALISVPEQVALDAGHLREAENVLKDKLGRDPSEGELADHTGLSMRRLAHLRKYKLPRSEGSLQRPTDEGEDIYAPAVTDRSDSDRIWHEFVYHDLDPIDQLILEHSIGLHGKPILQNQKIASKLRLSAGAISQRKARIQAKLDLRDSLRVF